MAQWLAKGRNLRTVTVTCKMQGVGKCRRVKCEKSAGSHPAIYTHEHTLKRVQQHALSSTAVYQLQRSGHGN